jgi:primary-amine oxidase
MGFCTTNLTLGCDCLGHIHYFPATLNDHKGNPMIIDKAIWCVMFSLG